MDVPEPASVVDERRKLPADQTLAVKLFDRQLADGFHAPIGSFCAFAAVVFHRDHANVPLRGFEIIHNDHALRIENQQLEIEPSEAIYVKKMFDAALNRRGHTGLIREMKEAGVRGRNGKEIKYTQIYEILRNEKYAGIYVYSVEGCRHRKTRLETAGAIRIDGAIPAIVDKNTFYEVQKIMDMRKQNGRKQNEYLCSGLVYCKCGAKMHIHRAPNRKGDKYVYYACSANCGAPTVREEVLVKAVTDYLKELLSDAMQLKIAHFLRSYRNHRKDFRATYTAVVKKQIAAKQTEYDNLVKNLSAATFAPEIIQDLNNRMKALKAEIETLDASVKDYEPYMALDGGEDGLDFYRAILKRWPVLLRQSGWLLFEVGETQAEEVEKRMRLAGLRSIGRAKDSAGYDRVVFGRV